MVAVVPAVVAAADQVAGEGEVEAVAVAEVVITTSNIIRVIIKLVGVMITSNIITVSINLVVGMVEEEAVEVEPIWGVTSHRLNRGDIGRFRVVRVDPRGHSLVWVKVLDPVVEEEPGMVVDLL